MEFMDRNSLWNRNNHAYRKHHSTGTAMLQLTDQIYEAAEKNEVSTIMGIDQSAAFDSICHKILLEKMKMYNFDQKTLNMDRKLPEFPITVRNNWRSQIKY